MKIHFNGKVLGVYDTEEEKILGISIPFNQLRRLDGLESGKYYEISIEPPQSKKSLNQNNLIWVIITQIAARQDMNKDDVYIQLLGMAEIETVQLAVANKKGIKEFMERQFRLVKVLDRNEKQIIFDCYLGLSQFTKQQATEFIKQLLFYAEQIGIDTSQYDL